MKLACDTSIEEFVEMFADSINILSREDFLICTSCLLKLSLEIEMKNRDKLTVIKDAKFSFDFNL